MNYFLEINKEKFLNGIEEYSKTEEETEQDVYPYPDIAAEFPGVGVAEMQQDPLHDEENDDDENKEAVASERNYNLGEIPMRNGTNDQEDGTHIVGNLDKPEMLEIIEKPVNNVFPEEVIELEDGIEIQDPANLEAVNNEDDSREIRNDNQEITRVDDDNNDDSTRALRRGERRRMKNPRYFKEEMVNASISNEVVKKEGTNSWKTIKKEMRRAW